MKTVALPFGIVLTGLLVVARVAVVARREWPKVSNGKRNWFGSIGALALVVASAGLTIGGGLPDIPLPYTNEVLNSRWLLPISVLTLSIFGLWGVARWLATRLRLHVEVRTSDGKIDEGATGHAIALLSDLAGAPAEGLEVPHGADVNVLNGSAITGTPEGRVAKLLVDLIQTVIGVTPWQITVDVVSQDVLSVHVSRNGRPAGSAVVERQALGLDYDVTPTDNSDSHMETAANSQGTKPDLHRFVAAVVVLALTKYHDFTGLYGTTDWRSLGLHYVATAQLKDGQQARNALARALDYDAGNLLSQVAFHYEVARHDVTSERLKAYAVWLKDLSNDTNCTGHLKRRVLHSRLAAWINYGYAADGPRIDPEIRAAADDLVAYYVAQKQLTQDGQTNTASKDLLMEQSKPAAASLILHVDDYYQSHGTAITITAQQRAQVGEWLKRGTGPLGDYQVGCYYAARPSPDKAAAIERFRHASMVNELADWMGKDPQLVAFRNEDEFRAALQADPRTDFLVLPRLEPFTRHLRAIGVIEAGDLASYEGNAVGLAAPLGIGVRHAARMIVLGKIGKSAEASEDLKQFSVELCAELLTRGKADTIDDARSAASHAQAILNAVQNRCNVWPKDENVISDWLKRL
ncbi:hypothetical protein [Kribbella caucasensis]|uniref:hypothetical protein n=1 Tax=Kribbella caucasensis TaxID=2512215 RepID=UPI00105E17F5|nr:hypothetical protein [Kribbella sp. VKM Ac-2527]